MIKTPFTELFGVKHPIMLAGMNWVTTPELVAAVCNAGGLGIFATARCTPKEARENIRKIRELTDKPFGIKLFNSDYVTFDGSHPGAPGRRGRSHAHPPPHPCPPFIARQLHALRRAGRRR